MKGTSDIIPWLRQQKYVKIQNQKNVYYLRTESFPIL